MTMERLTTFNLKRWIDEHRHLLKPPVGNAQVWKDSEFMVTIVGGPNQRTDYHVDPGEEFFHQIEGDMILRVMEDGKRVDIPIREGDIFLLPAFVPHSPQRKAGTVGMVIERLRRQDELDHLRWYCDNCGAIMHDASFHLTDLTTQLQPVIAAYYSSEELRTCKSCGWKFTPPAPLSA
ncbi:MAG: 3-hydroxyanthranilate 3,4-dioxygenase [Myxococcota bacterium]|nr:3-hydroxyanthranilate 3,4-dioxygenase [Myxococcota bacterium]